jgi:hypothetical protein
MFGSDTGFAVHVIHQLQRCQSRFRPGHQPIPPSIRRVIFAVGVYVFRIVLVMNQRRQRADQIRAGGEALPQRRARDDARIFVLVVGQKLPAARPAVDAIVFRLGHRPAVRGHDFGDRGTARSVPAARVADFVAQLLVAGELQRVLRQPGRVFPADIILAVGDDLAFG